VLIRESVKMGVVKSEQYPVGGCVNIRFNVTKSKTSRPLESRHRIFRPTVLIAAMSEREKAAVFQKGVTYPAHKPTANALVTLSEWLCSCLSRLHQHRSAKTQRRYSNLPLCAPGKKSGGRLC
jgi:hypothetical protein